MAIIQDFVCLFPCGFIVYVAGSTLILSFQETHCEVYENRNTGWGIIAYRLCKRSESIKSAANYMVWEFHRYSPGYQRRRKIECRKLD